MDGRNPSISMSPANGAFGDGGGQKKKKKKKRVDVIEAAMHFKV